MSRKERCKFVQQKNSCENEKSRGICYLSVLEEILVHFVCKANKQQKISRFFIQYGIFLLNGICNLFREAYVVMIGASIVSCCHVIRKWFAMFIMHFTLSEENRKYCILDSRSLSKQTRRCVQKVFKSCQPCPTNLVLVHCLVHIGHQNCLIMLLCSY